MTELKLLRMEPILARSTLSTAAAESDTEGVNCATGCSVATGGSVFAGTGVDTSGLAGHLLCSSIGEKIMAVRPVRECLNAIRYAVTRQLFYICY